MKSTRLDRAVARATGEPVRRIRQMGFSVLPVPRPCGARRRPPLSRTRKDG